jgi:post-segregation antitoxin (ccd killing protein)
MTTVEIELPDALAQQARSAGLLAPALVERWLREQLRKEAIERLTQAHQKLAKEPIPPMTTQEIHAEIEAWRSEQRRATGS